MHGGAVADIAERRDDAPEGVWGPSYRWLTAGLLLTIVGIAFETLAVATTMPATVRDLGGLAWYGWAFSAFMLANLVGITCGGIEADRQPLGRPLLAGGLMFAAGLVAAGLAPTMPLLIGARVVQGFGGGVLSALVYVMVGRGYHEAARPRMLALMSSAWVVPGLAGPGLAGLIADLLGWRWVFLGLAPLLVVAWLLIAPALGRFAAPTGAPPRDWARIGAALALALGAGMLIAGLAALPGLAGALLVLGGLALALPALVRLLPAGTLLAWAGLPAVIAVHGLLSAGFFGVDAFVPLALTGLRGQSALAAGLVLTAATLCWTAGAWLQAHLTARRSRRLLVSLGVLVCGLGVASAATLLSPSVPVVLAPLAWGLAGLGMGLAYSTNTLTVLETAAPGEEGNATAAMQLANILGIALGTGLGGVIVGDGHAAAAPSAAALLLQYGLMLGVLLLALLAAQRLPSSAAGGPDAGAGPGRGAA